MDVWTALCRSEMFKRVECYRHDCQHVIQFDSPSRRIKMCEAATFFLFSQRDAAARRACGVHYVEPWQEHGKRLPKLVDGLFIFTRTINQSCDVLKDSSRMVGPLLFAAAGLNGEFFLILLASRVTAVCASARP
jgi:hypothetical protein